MEKFNDKSICLRILAEGAAINGGCTVVEDFGWFGLHNQEKAEENRKP
ncbi:MAG: hypothetical protein H8D88_00460 [Bacteroidetes bacterium]|nr:hypothetical protein [Bacteroidota bacterium]